MQFHPTILSMVAQDRIAEMHARAESDRRVRAAKTRQAAPAKRHAFRDHAAGHRASAQPAGWSHSHQEEKQLVSVGRAGSDDCL